MFRPEAITIDFFGTLVEEIFLPVNAICAKICLRCPSVKQSTFVKYWVKAFSKLTDESYGDSFILQKEIEKRSLQQAIDHFKVDLKAAELTEELINYRSRPNLLPASRTVLAAARMPVCLVTNIDNEDIQKALQFTGLHFNCVVTSEDCRAYKPRHEVYERALNRLKLPPQKVLHVGDSHHGDVTGAKALNIKVLWINQKKRTLTPEQVRPDYMAADLNELRRFIE